MMDRWQGRRGAGPRPAGLRHYSKGKTQNQGGGFPYRSARQLPRPREPASAPPTPCRSSLPPTPALPPRPPRAASRPAPAPPPASSADPLQPSPAPRSAPDSRRPGRAAAPVPPTPLAASARRSAVPAARRVAASSARHSRPSAPCPTAGNIHDGSNTSVMCVASPRRSNPACARMMASRPCSSSFRSRVSTLPRIVVSFRSGRRCSACARRRRLLVATTAPCGRSSKRAWRRDTNTSPAGPRSGTAPSVSPVDRGRRQVLQAVDRHVHGVRQQGALNLLGEHALAADLRQRQVAHHVAGRFDQDQLDGPRRRQGPQPSRRHNWPARGRAGCRACRFAKERS